MYRLRYSFGYLLFALTVLSITSAFAQTFATGVPYSANAGATLLRADFNNDGNTDLLSISAADAGTVLIGNGDGTFHRQDFDPQSNLADLIAADVNNDGKMDVIGLDPAHKVGVLVGNGDGTFQAPRVFTAGTNPISVAVADFNGDGKLDFAAGWSDTDTTGAAAPNHIVIEYGDGAGNFSVGTTLNNVGSPNPFPGNGCHGYSITKLVATDLNFDGKPDIAFISGGAGCDVELGDIYWLRNNGGGSFTGADISTLSVPRDLRASDFDQNGPADLAVPYAGCHTPCSGLNLYLNSGTSAKSIKAVPQPTNVNIEINFGAPVIADLNNDGRKDLAYSVSGYSYSDSNYHQGLQIARQNSDGTLSNGPFIPTSAKVTDLNSGDFNRDGRIDLAGIVNGQVVVWLNTTATAQACAPGTDRTVSVCAPGGSSTTPVRFLVTPTSKLPISGMKIYVDGQGVFTTVDDRISALVNLAAGTHSVVVKAWDKNGPFSKSFTLNVSGSSGGTCSAGANRTVHLCSPTDGQTTSSPVRVLATARSDSGVTALQVYIDGTLKYQAPNGVKTVDQNFSLGAGSHRITVKGWDSAGSYSSSATITVSGTSTVCTAGANRTVNICSPANGSTVSSPVHIAAGLRSDSGVTAAQIYVDGTVKWQGPAGTTKVDQNLAMAAGSHRITVKGWDSTGSFSNAVTITVH